MYLTMKNARSDEISVALDLLYKAAIWLRDKNINYWQNWLNPPEKHIAWVTQGFDNGEFYFVHNNEDSIVGMFRLQYADEMFWGKRSDMAGYIHSFTTNREYKGNRIGYQILKMIEKELARVNCEFLRLDCSPDIEELCKYYETYGFEPKETIVVHDEKLRLYEKRIG